MIYICIPAHNEDRTIGVMLWKIRKVMADFPRDYQVLVVDDASTDATQEVLTSYTRILPLTILRNEERRGYAASLEMLLREAVRRSSYPKRDIVVTLQADFTDEPDEIPTLVKRIEGGADVVSGAARLRKGDAPRAVRWARRVLRFLLRRAKWAAGISDPFSGFRAYRLITLRKAMAAHRDGPFLAWDGWAANAALLRAVAPFARRVEEVPVPTRYDRRQRASRFRAVEAGRDVIRMMRARRNGRPAAAPPTAGPQRTEAGEQPQRADSPRPQAQRPKSGPARASDGRGPVRRTGAGTANPEARQPRERKVATRRSGAGRPREQDADARQGGAEQPREEDSAARRPRGERPPGQGSVARQAGAAPPAERNAVANPPESMTPPEKNSAGPEAAEPHGEAAASIGDAAAPTGGARRTRTRRRSDAQAEGAARTRSRGGRRRSGLSSAARAEEAGTGDQPEPVDHEHSKG